MRARFIAVSLFVGAALAGCGRGADTGATSNANAPKGPGTGNPTVSQAPQQGDRTSGRGSSGPKGSLGNPNASGGANDVVGATGSGGAGQSTQPATGLNGGLGTNTLGASGQPNSVPQGSPNTSPGNAVGGR